MLGLQTVGDLRYRDDFTTRVSALDRHQSNLSGAV